MSRVPAIVIAAFMVLLPLTVRPLGVGDISVGSNLNTPLDARIALHTSDPTELDTINVRLASVDQFANAGVDRPFILSKLRFSVDTSNRKQPGIRVTSSDPVNEPFLNFLLEINWGKGRVLREYTILLDPPVYGSAIRTHTDATVPTRSTGAMTDKPKAKPQPAKTRTATSPPRASAPRTNRGTVMSAETAGGTYGPVESNDTLWSLADRFRGDSQVSIQQMMLAMLRLNPVAFADGNVNMLREGAILQIPSAEQARDLSRAAALDEVRQQHAAWRQMRAGQPMQPRAETPASSARATGSSTPKPSMATSDGEAKAMADAAKMTTEAVKPELKVLSGGAGEGGVGRAGEESSTKISSLEQELRVVRDEADAQRRENEDLSGKLQEAEAIMEELKRVVDVQNSDIANLQGKLSQDSAEKPEAMVEPKAEVAATMGAAGDAAGEKAVETAPETMTQAPPEGQAAAKTPAKKSVPLPPPASEKPAGFMDVIQKELKALPVSPEVAGGGIVGILVLLVVVVLLRKRKSESEDVDDDEFAPEPESVVVAAAEPVVDATLAEEESDQSVDEDATIMASDGLPDTDVSEVPVADIPPEARDTVIRQPGDDDPIAEINVYLAYERFDQAQRLAEDAIAAHPEGHEYKLKLAEIHYAAKNIAGFQIAAIALRNATGEQSEQMDTVRRWWDEMDTGVGLFDTAAASIEPASDDESEGGIFDVTAGDDENVLPELVGDATGSYLAEELETGGSTTDVDFDLEFEIEEDAESAAEEEASDVPDTLESARESGDEVVGEGTTVDFDLGFEDTVTGESTLGSDTEVDFDLGFDEPSVDVTEKSAEPAADATEQSVGSDTDIDFDLDSLVGEESGELETSETALGETSTGTETSLNFDLDSLAETSEISDAERESTTDPAAPSLDFDLEVPGSETDQPEAALSAISTDEVDFDLGFGDTTDDTGSDANALGTVELNAPGPTGDGEAAVSRDIDIEPLIERAVDVDAAAGAASSLEIDEEFTGLFDGEQDAESASEQPFQEPGGNDELQIDEDFAGLFGEDAEPQQGEDSLTEDSLTEELTVLDLSIGEETEDPTDIRLPESEPPVNVMEPAEAEDAGLDLDALLIDDSDDFDEVADATAVNDVDDEVTDLNLGVFEPETSAVSEDSVVDFDIGTLADDATTGTDADLTDLDFDLGELDAETPESGESMDGEGRTLALGRGPTEELDETQTKLDLAQAYVEMGDADGARNILGEVMAEGNDAQRSEAEDLLRTLE